MNLQNLKQFFKSHGCNNIYVKKLSPNDNSKNQVYLSGSFDILNIFPASDITVANAGEWKRQRFKASTSFYWLMEDGRIENAPNAQFILYPKYPEVRFSGFLKDCLNAPSELMASRIPERLLFLSVTQDRHILGFVAAPETELANEYNRLQSLTESGVFNIIELVQDCNRTKLLDEMQRIVRAGWINSKRLDKNARILDCDAPNCGGYTLEAELGIVPNANSEPDFCGWEIKQFHSAKNICFKNEIITLLTPEPTGGYYVHAGVDAFIRKYGYFDKTGRLDRMNFGGIHKVNTIHTGTKLKLELLGFDKEESKIMNVAGSIALLDVKGVEAASWSFASLLKHWNRKHNQACYVPSHTRKEPNLQYKYGNKLLLGTGTDFLLFLKQLSDGNIYYDPGIKMENISTVPKIKRRSQFRIKSGHLANLYNNTEFVDLMSE